MTRQFGLRLSMVILVGLALAACGAPSGPAASGTVSATAAASQPTSVPVSTPSTALPTVATTAVGPTVAAPTTAPTRAPTAASQPAAPTATQAAQAGNAFDIIVNAQRAQLAAKAFRSKTTTTAATGTQTTTTLEYVNPDRVHLTLANGNETIVIKGVGTYSKTSGGKWTMNPVDLSSTVFAQFDPKTIEDLKNSIVTSNVKLVGPDLLDGKPMLVYTYNTLIKGLGIGGSDIQGTTKLWVGATDSLPYKRESVQDSVVTKGEKTNSVSTYEYDPSIKIEKPI